MTLFVGVNRSGKSIVARALAAVTTALARAEQRYAGALAKRRGWYAEPKPFLVDLFYEELGNFAFDLPVRMGARSTVVRLVYGDKVLVVERDVLGNPRVEGDLVEAAARRVEETLRVSAREDFFDYEPFYPWTALNACNLSSCGKVDSNGVRYRGCAGHHLRGGHRGEEPVVHGGFPGRTGQAWRLPKRGARGAGGPSP